MSPFHASSTTHYPIFIRATIFIGITANNAKPVLFLFIGGYMTLSFVVSKALLFLAGYLPCFTGLSFFSFSTFFSGEVSVKINDFLIFFFLCSDRSFWKLSYSKGRNASEFKEESATSGSAHSYGSVDIVGSYRYYWIWILGCICRHCCVYRCTQVYTSRLERSNGQFSISFHFSKR